MEPLSIGTRVQVIGPDFDSNEFDVGQNGTVTSGPDESGDYTVAFDRPLDPTVPTHRFPRTSLDVLAQ